MMIVQMNILEMPIIHVRMLQLIGASVCLINMVPCCCYVDVFCNGYSSAVLWLLFKSYSTDPELENGGKMTFFACYCLDAHISSFDWWSEDCAEGGRLHIPILLLIEWKGEEAKLGREGLWFASLFFLLSHPNFWTLSDKNPSPFQPNSGMNELEETFSTWLNLCFSLLDSNLG